QIDEAARAAVPQGSGHDWNSAMMDLGAAVCTARTPLCGACPLRALCASAPVDMTELRSLRKRYAKAPSPQNAIAFEQTTRFARGRIVERLRGLEAGDRISLLDLHHELQTVPAAHSIDDFNGLIFALERDGLLSCDGEAVSLRD
ncbi:MAG: hypothetical protein ABI282_09680, partial [Candidatus Baltobacteraceae bacterium]